MVKSKFRKNSIYFGRMSRIEKFPYCPGECAVQEVCCTGGSYPEGYSVCGVSCPEGVCCPGGCVLSGMGVCCPGGCAVEGGVCCDIITHTPAVDRQTGIKTLSSLNFVCWRSKWYQGFQKSNSPGIVPHGRTCIRHALCAWCLHLFVQDLCISRKFYILVLQI